jgi:hypothetical protein
MRFILSFQPSAVSRQLRNHRGQRALSVVMHEIQVSRDEEAFEPRPDG